MLGAVRCGDSFASDFWRTWEFDSGLAVFVGWFGFFLRFFLVGSAASRGLSVCESGLLGWDSGDCVGYPQDYGGLAG
jgi:hypothetical protein